MHNESANRTRYEWLALRCQSGESEAFEDLVAVMERPLLYYAMSLTGSQDRPGKDGLSLPEFFQHQSKIRFNAREYRLSAHAGNSTCGP